MNNLNNFNKSTITRAKEILKTKKVNDPIKAMLMALEEESKIYKELIEGKTDRSKLAINTMMNIVYELANKSAKG